tara:strand:- start:340 stop:690 length:351 start_codon:yes stop_codon:yes gene_type:complete
MSSEEVRNRIFDGYPKDSSEEEKRTQVLHVRYQRYADSTRTLRLDFRDGVGIDVRDAGEGLEVFYANRPRKVDASADLRERFDNMHFDYQRKVSASLTLADNVLGFLGGALTSESD